MCGTWSKCSDELMNASQWRTWRTSSGEAIFYFFFAAIRCQTPKVPQVQKKLMEGGGGRDAFFAEIPASPEKADQRGGSSDAILGFLLVHGPLPRSVDKQKKVPSSPAGGGGTLSPAPLGTLVLHIV